MRALVAAALLPLTLTLTACGGDATAPATEQTEPSPDLGHTTLYNKHDNYIGDLYETSIALNDIGRGGSADCGLGALSPELEEQLLKLLEEKHKDR